MAKAEAPAEAKPSIVVRVKEFYEDVMTEMKKVTWPSREELKSSTSTVLMLLGIVSVIIYAYDYVFQLVVFSLFRLI
jgi:preprotein translocase subunit SecE